MSEGDNWWGNPWHQLGLWSVWSVFCSHQSHFGWPHPSPGINARATLFKQTCFFFSFHSEQSKMSPVQTESKVSLSLFLGNKIVVGKISERFILTWKFSDRVNRDILIRYGVRTFTIYLFASGLAEVCLPENTSWTSLECITVTTQVQEVFHSTKSTGTQCIITQKKTSRKEIVFVGRKWGPFFEYYKVPVKKIHPKRAREINKSVPQLVITKYFWYINQGPTIQDKIPNVFMNPKFILQKRLNKLNSFPVWVCAW